jgi:hypothetical protein
MTELQLTQQCYLAFNRKFSQYLNNLFRIKNELDNHPRKTQRDKMIQLSENKATGVRKGIADFVLINKTGGSVWLELKLPKEKQSEEQVLFQNLVLEYYVCYSVEEFITLCEKILK